MAQAAEEISTILKTAAKQDPEMVRMYLLQPAPKTTQACCQWSEMVRISARAIGFGVLLRGATLPVDGLARYLQ